MKNKIFKNTIATLGSLCFVSLAPLLVFACGKADNNFNRNYDFSKLWEVKENGLEYEDATIVNWIDGDTLVFDSPNHSDDKLRISMIDTPETHVKDGNNWVDTTGKELIWGNKAKVFGQEQMPIGSKIRIVFDVGMTYDRYPGSIFYGDNFSKSYSYEIIKNGLALPFYKSTEVSVSIDTTSNLLHYLSIPIADAYNYAKANHVGLFGENLEEILSTHGSTDTSVTKYDPDDRNSAYHYADLDFWK